MSDKSLVERLDDVILSGVNAANNKAHEYLGCNKYDLANLTDIAAGLSAAIYGMAATQVMPVATMLTLMGTVYAIGTPIKNEKLEQLENDFYTTGALHEEYMEQYSRDKSCRALELVIGVGLTAALLTVTPDPDPIWFTPEESYQRKAMLPFIKHAPLLMITQSLARFFRGCDYNPRKPDESHAPAEETI